MALSRPDWKDPPPLEYVALVWDHGAKRTREHFIKVDVPPLPWMFREVEDGARVLMERKFGAENIIFFEAFRPIDKWVDDAQKKLGITKDWVGNGAEEPEGE